MRKRALLTTILALVGCGHTPTAPAPVGSGSAAPEIAPLPTGLNQPSVLVRAGSYLYTRPPPAGQRARNPAFPAGIVQPEAHASRYRLLHDGGDWIEVESVAATSLRTRHCQTTSDYFKTLAIRVFVARADLASVLTRPFAAAFADGTRVELYAGVPVSGPLPESAPEGQQRRVVFADGLVFPMAIPDDAVGLVYAEPPEHSTTEPTTHALASGTEITLDGRESKLEYVTARALGLDGEHRHRIYAERDVDHDLLVDLEGSCGRYRARVARSAVVPANPHPVESFDFDVGVALRTTWIARGTAISWVDGTPAGVARENGWRQDPGEPTGTRACFRYTFNSGAPPDTPEASLLLCAEQTALTPAPSRRSDDDVARIGPLTRHYFRLELDAGDRADGSKLTALLRATAKDELLAGHGDAVAIALPGETAAQAKKKVPRGVARWVVRERIIKHNGFTERRTELFDETVNPPRSVQQRAAIVNVGMPDSVDERMLFDGAIVGILDADAGAPPD
ncbi:MAG: hypothetical protein ABJE95_13415 [Byssovorax sp.]